MRRTNSSGVSLLELLFATVIISVVMILTAAIVQRSLRAQRNRSLQRFAQQLAQDQLETLKAHPFPYLIVTAEQDAPDQGCLAGASAYDRNPEHFAPVVLQREGMSFLRQTCIEPVVPSSEGRLLRAEIGSSSGLKRIVVRVRWPADHPSSEEELESIVSDPAGAMTVTSKKETVSAKVFCTDGVRDPAPCGGVWFYLFSPVSDLRDMAVSNRDGLIQFKQAPDGPCVIRPQPEPGEDIDPVEYSTVLPEPENGVTLSSFTVTRSLAMLSLRTNRANTLVAVTPGVASKTLPDILLRQDQDTGVYGRIITDPDTLKVTPGYYSVRCWAPGNDGRLQAMSPSGGLNALFTAGGSYAFECRF